MSFTSLEKGAAGIMEQTEGCFLIQFFFDFVSKNDISFSFLRNEYFVSKFC